MVTAAEDHASFEDRPLQPASADEFLRVPLRAVVIARAVWPGTKKAQEDDPLDASRSRYLDDGRSAINVHAPVRLTAKLAVDARAVHDRVTSCEGGLECLDVGYVNTCPTPDDHYVVPAGTQHRGNMAAYEARPACDRDP